jgi:cobalamin biosynthesis protein CobT
MGVLLDTVLDIASAFTFKEAQAEAPAADPEEQPDVTDAEKESTADGDKDDDGDSANAAGNDESEGSDAEAEEEAEEEEEESEEPVDIKPKLEAGKSPLQPASLPCAVLIVSPRCFARSSLGQEDEKTDNTVWLRMPILCSLTQPRKRFSGWKSPAY